MKSPFVSRKKYEEEIQFFKKNCDGKIIELEIKHKEEKEKLLKDLPEILKNFSRISMVRDPHSYKYRLCIDMDIDRMSQGLMWGNDCYWIEYIANNIKHQIIESLKSRNCFREVDETDRRGYGYFYNTTPSSNYLKD